MYNLIFCFFLKFVLSQSNTYFDKFNNSNLLNTSNFDLYSKNLINSKRKLLSNTKPIRIYIDTSYLDKSFNNKEIKQIYFYALNRAKSALEQLIEVERDSDTMDVSDTLKNLFKGDNNRGFNEYLMNSSFLDGSIKPEADLFILVRTSSSDEMIRKCSEQYEILDKNEKGRPTIGYFVINTDLDIEEFDDKNDKFKSQKELYSTIFLHQLTHILGFSKSILIANKDVEFKEVNIKRISEENPIRKTLIYSENLLKEAQNYYGLTSSIEGLELEELPNEKCSEYIHWDSRILLGDYMALNIYDEEQTISELTLTLLEETGFYKVNYFTGGLSKFGRGKGNKFFDKDCNELLESELVTENTNRKSSFPNEFCASHTKTTCSSGRLSKGICDYYEPDMMNIGNYSRKDWGNFGDKYADYCPISISEISRSEKQYSLLGNCQLGDRENYGHYAFGLWETSKKQYDYLTFNNSYGESFSKRSFCAFSSVISTYDSVEKKNIYKGFVRPTCYEMYCSEESLTIKIDKLFYVCPRGGGIISIEGDYEGHLICPDYNLICSQTILCNNLFDCIFSHSELKKNIVKNYIVSNDVSVQIVLPDVNKNYDKAYELSDDGQCPKYCSKCNEFRQCLECDSSENLYYIGVRKDDKNPITCNKTNPQQENLAFYNETISGKTYFYKCLDNCIKCEEADKCLACSPEFNLTSNKLSCIDRIDGCKIYNKTSIFKDKQNNNGFDGYQYCEQCNNDEGYYCLNDIKEKCFIINDDINSYFNNKYECKQKCESLFDYCYNCSDKECFQCKSGYILNENKSCVEGIPHCQKHNTKINPVECINCEENYSCLNYNKKICEKIGNEELYYLVDNDLNSNDCRELCTVTFDKKCKTCNNVECTKCIDGYFVYDKKYCIQSIENCEEHFYDGTNKYCELCKNEYFCIDNKKEICQKKDENEMKEYVKMENSINPTCYEKCFKKFNYCLECIEDRCTNCIINTRLKADGKNCEVNPDMEQIGNCLIKFHEENLDIKEINLVEFPLNYVNNFPNFNVIDHYINKDYTITVFIHSECTEDLLKQGYFKIDSKELQKAIVSDFGVNEKLIYSVFITHNFNSHFGYFDKDLIYLDTSKDGLSAS